MIAMVTTFLLNDLWKPWLQNVSSMIYDNHGYNIYLSSMVYEDHGLSIYFPQWYMTTMATKFIYT